MLERFAYDMLKMTAFSAIAVIIFTLVAIGSHRLFEPIFGQLDLSSYFGQVGNPKRCSVFFDQIL